jgi:hypothetical protein
LGGNAVTLVCQSINFTGTISVSGANGGNSTGNNIGASGGGGGVVFLATPTYTANTGTIAVAGGTGGTCGAYTGCGAGGNGGNGWSADSRFNKHAALLVQPWGDSQRAGFGFNCRYAGRVAFFCESVAEVALWMAGAWTKDLRQFPRAGG